MQCSLLQQVKSGGMPSQGVSKALTRLKEGLSDQEYYESQQVVKTVYWRYRTRKLLQDSYELLQAASQAQLTDGQVWGFQPTASAYQPALCQQL